MLPFQVVSPVVHNSVRPEDVGQRVSFQYELPNGFVSEAVGMLEAWDEPAKTYLVRTKAGDLRRVPLLGVRFGKVIPAEAVRRPPGPSPPA